MVDELHLRTRVDGSDGREVPVTHVAEVGQRSEEPVVLDLGPGAPRFPFFDGPPKPGGILRV